MQYATRVRCTTDELLCKFQFIAPLRLQAREQGKPIRGKGMSPEVDLNAMLSYPAGVCPRLSPESTWRWTPSLYSEPKTEETTPHRRE